MIDLISDQDRMTKALESEMTQQCKRCKQRVRTTTTQNRRIGKLNLVFDDLFTSSRPVYFLCSI